jgi:RAT1-interacting protein
MDAARPTSVWIYIYPALSYQIRHLSRFISANTCKKWYMQSHLLGVSQIFVGHRTSEDVLCDTEWVNVDDLPARIQRWDPQHSIDKGQSILNSLREFCRDETAMKRDDDRIWRVEVYGGPPPSGFIRLSDTHRVYVRDLRADEKVFVNRRSGQRIGIIPARAVEELRKI